MEINKDWMGMGFLTLVALGVIVACGIAVDYGPIPAKAAGIAGVGIGLVGISGIVRLMFRRDPVLVISDKDVEDRLSHSGPMSIPWMDVISADIVTVRGGWRAVVITLRDPGRYRRRMSLLRRCTFSSGKVWLHPMLMDEAPEVVVEAIRAKQRASRAASACPGDRLPRA